jgi:TRAP-type uncharacterized transport system substrate-binding protein
LGYLNALDIPRMMAPKLIWHRRRGRLALLLGLAALPLAFATTRSRTHQAPRPITLTAGPLGTTRALVAQSLIDAIEARGGHGRLLATENTEEELEQTSAGSVDFALVSGAYRIERRPHVREIVGLHVEALHLLVKADLADAVGQSLGALRGHTVGLASQGSVSAALVSAALTFASLAPDDGTNHGYVARHLDLPELEALVRRGDRAALPDAVADLATVPSKVAALLARSADYRLVALPFADAFRLNALITDDAAQAPVEIERQFVSDTVIPPFTYQTEPAVPPEPLHTFGAQLILVANDAVPLEAVASLLDTIFDSEFARGTHPPLDRGLLDLPPRLEQHPGALAYIRRNKPFITHDTVGELSSTFSVVGALVGAWLFLRQWWRQRKQAEQDETFGNYLLKVVDIERRVTALELGATLELQPLAGLQSEVLQLKREALDQFASGDLGNQSVLSDLLMPLNAARDHIGDLILHVRDYLEDRAQAHDPTAGAAQPDPSDKPAGSGDC